MNQVSIAKVVQLLNAHLEKQHVKLLCLDLSQTHGLPRTIDTVLGVVEWMMNQLLITLGYRPNQTVNLSNLANATRRIGCISLATELERLNTGLDNARSKTCIDNIVDLLLTSAHWNTMKTICSLLKIEFPVHSSFEIELWLKRLRDFGDDLDNLGAKIERDYRSSKDVPARRNVNLENLVEALVIHTFLMIFRPIFLVEWISSRSQLPFENCLRKTSLTSSVL